MDKGTLRQILESQGFTVEERGSDLYATGKHTVTCRFHETADDQYMLAVSQALGKGIIKPGLVILPEPDGSYTFHIHPKNGTARELYSVAKQIRLFFTRG
ncbi:MAG: hypothetical protein KC418_24115 [Anaerolineales bacterium]|nr:hypothetical protein [Anaerolineales bacterium]